MTPSLSRHTPQPRDPDPAVDLPPETRSQVDYRRPLSIFYQKHVPKSTIGPPGPKKIEGELAIFEPSMHCSLDPVTPAQRKALID